MSLLLLLPQIVTALFAALAGLAFGSFLNVCLYRWPRGEGISLPASHCPACNHTLAWWQNLPLLSYCLLRGRCHDCHSPISLRYPAVEALVGLLWAFAGWRAGQGILDPSTPAPLALYGVFLLATGLLFLWLLVALAALDLAELWLPDLLTLPGTLLGLTVFALQSWLLHRLAQSGLTSAKLLATPLWQTIAQRILAALLCAAALWLIRWLYFHLRHHEGLGLGDVKLIALLTAWLGAPRTALCFALALAIGLLAIPLSSLPALRRANSGNQIQLPLGSFLAVGGIIAYFWGNPLVALYLRLSGLN